MEREWIRRLVKSLGDLIFLYKNCNKILIKSLQDSRELNIWNVERSKVRIVARVTRIQE